MNIELDYLCAICHKVEPAKSIPEGWLEIWIETPQKIYKVQVCCFSHLEKYLCLVKGELGASNAAIKEDMPI